MKSNYIAFSLWNGSNFNLNALGRDMELLRYMHPGWKIIAYYDRTTSDDVLAELENLEVILVDMSQSDMHPPLWKFLAANLPDAGYVVFRDTEIGYSISSKEMPTSIRDLHKTMVEGFDDIPANNKNSAVLSYICGLFTPVVELKRLIGGF